jgi:transposase-like protein
MSRSERDRAHVVRQVVEHRLSQCEASERLGIGIRQLKRLVRSWKRQGDGGLVSRQRGRVSHNRLPEALRVGTLNSTAVGVARAVSSLDSGTLGRHRST